MYAIDFRPLVRSSLMYMFEPFKLLPVQNEAPSSVIPTKLHYYLPRFPWGWAAYAVAPIYVRRRNVDIEFISGIQHDCVRVFTVSLGYARYP